MTLPTNLYAGWAGIFLGCIAGAVQGLSFHDEQWLGGYGSWPRRMLRLGHIALIALGILNLALALTLDALEPAAARWISRLFLTGAVAMPLVCYLSAVRKGFRHLFFVPAVSILVALGLLLRGLVLL
jgi:hypothetical protein